VRSTLAEIVDELDRGEPDLARQLAHDLLDDVRKAAQDEHVRSLRWQIRRDLAAAAACVEETRYSDALGFLRGAVRLLEDEVRVAR
jgi:hypothetical protein